MNEEFNFEDAGSVNKQIPENKTLKKHITKIIMATVIILLLIIIVIIIISLSLSSSGEKKEKTYTDEDIIGKIKCVYNIEVSNVAILGNDFVKESDFDIEINGKKIKYSKEYHFTEFGQQNITFLIYNNLNMNNMFKDISSLTSVEMISDKNAKIISMNSAFENCRQLSTFTISGFNLVDLKSTHKLFYKSGLTSFNVDYLDTQNLLDISYMFSETNIEKIDLSLLNTINVFIYINLLNFLFFIILY